MELITGLIAPVLDARLQRDGQDRERKRAEASLLAALKEKEMLLKEVHHRVKNNLAAIIGLLDLQGPPLRDEGAKTAMMELSNRIRSMALVHEQLYESGDFSRIDFQGYLDTLVAYIGATFEGYANIHVSVAAIDVTMGLDCAVPCGLLITELLTNAFKYAFPKGKPGAGAERCEIAVSVERNGASYLLSVSDNGVGLPPDLDWMHTTTLGLVLVRMLGLHQLQGHIELDRIGGTTFRVRFAPNDLNRIRTTQ